MKKMLTLILTAITMCGMAMAKEAASRQRELRGRDIVQIGKMTTLTGVLAANGHEWQLKAGETVYDVHLGPSFYREEKGVELKDGETATITGFLHETDMAVSTIKLGEATYALRDENGRPAWAGRGRRGGHGEGGHRGGARDGHGRGTHKCEKE